MKVKSKAVLILVLAIIFTSCKSDSKASINKKTLPQFSSVKEMLEDASDYYEENGSLKFISSDKENLHIQVSNPILKNDLESVKEKIVKRDIVYIAFQSFAQTDIKELTITSIPSDLENRKIYYKEYKKTIKINRAKAKQILSKFLESENFNILYTEDNNGIWLPNDNFSKLQFDKLEEVFNEMAKE